MGITLTAIGAYVTTAAGVAEIGSTVIVGSITVNTAIGFAILIGAEYGLSAALAPSSPNASGTQQFNLKQPIPARRRYYGKNKAGGYFAFIQTDGGDLFEAILIASHEIQFVEHWIGDRVVTLNGSGDVTAPSSMLDAGFSRFTIKAHAGTPDQTAESLLFGTFSSLWTTDHRLRGIAYSAFQQHSVEAKKVPTFYPGGSQLYRAVFFGSRVYNINGGQDYTDPSTWSFGHDNAADVIRDFLVSEDGMRLPQSAWLPAFDDWQAAQAICEESITLASGDHDRRYRIVGGYDLNAAPKDTLGKMLAACDGYLFMRGDGALSLKVGSWEAPTVTITDAHIRSISLTQGLGPFRQANEVRGTIVDPDQDYQPVELTPWRDEDDISLRGEVLSKTLDLTFVPTHNQGRRLLKIAAMRANPELSGTMTTDLYGLNALGERRIHLTSALEGIDADCEVTSFKVDPGTMSCEIGFSSVRQDAYEFDSDTEEQGPGTIPDSGSDNPSFPAPTSPTGLTAMNSTGNVTVSFLSPNDTNVYACRIWRDPTAFVGATDVFGQIFCAPSQLLARTDMPGNGTWKYWATAESISADASAETGPATVTV